MSSLRTMFTILSTAVVTSIFWITVYSGAAGEAPPPSQQQAAAGAPSAATVADLPPGQAVTATLEPEDGLELVLAPSGMAIPVAGISSRQLTDTFTAARSGGARRHNAIDIMAPRGTPVIAAARGTVEKLHFSQGGGGITVYVRSDDGQWMHYYAHLDAYVPGLAEGQRVEQGQQLGTVGFTGNASPAGPHLHFAVNRMAPGQRWYQGTPVNPYPLLVGR